MTHQLSARALRGARYTIALCLLTLATSAAAATPEATCEKTAAKSLAKCVKSAAKAHQKCYVGDDGGACAPGDATVGKALSKLDGQIVKKCTSDAIVQQAGYGASATVATLSARLQQFCLAEAASLGSRSYGGPHGAAYFGTPSSRDCMNTAAKEGSKLIGAAAKTMSKCVNAVVGGKSCDLAKTSAKLDKAETKAGAKIAGKCPPSVALEKRVALTSTQFAERAVDQAECVVAAAHPDTSPLDIDCGPRSSVPVPARGTYVQVVLDQASTGTRCGDGSDYAFWMRLAPAGQPVENVVVAMQGGGVCIFESDCSSVPAGLFEALNDVPETTGVMSNDPGVSPFANYTKVYLPYCTQDVFIGGGATSDFGSVVVERFGGLNLRAALRHVRDVIWSELDATTAEGYSPDRVTALFGGFSAGGFGTLYNYHYVLDDLQWANTTAFPDSSLALDNGETLGLGSLGALVIPDDPPLGWDALALLPPYCFSNSCPVGPTVMAATSPRLKAVPGQQFMVISNQNDSTQVNTTFFDDTPTWVNALRSAYCDTADLNGVRYFHPALSSSFHVISNRNDLFTTLAVDGEIMRDWLETGVVDGDNVLDRVEEGTLVDDIPGVNAFPCTVD